MITVEQARQFAMSLPGASEQDHHGLDSFRVRGRIFATVPDEHHLRIMVDDSTTLSAVEEYPGVCEAFYWGKRLACVVVAIDAADPDLVRELVTDAWLRKAPKSVVRGFQQ